MSEVEDILSNSGTMMVHVESDAILEIDYAPDTATLHVRFTDGGWYHYSHVPERVYHAFLAADSLGRFFHDHIRDRYPYRRDR